MKFFIAFVAVIAVAVASPVLRTKPATNEIAELEAIIAAIQSPSTDPATAALLEQQLISIIGTPISVGPAIVETNPISVGPAIVDFPLPDGGVVTADESAVIQPSPVVQPSPVITPSPVVIGEIPSGASPLVQIIVNVNQQESVVAPSPADTPVIEEVHVPGPVNVVDNVIAPEPVVEPIVVVEPVVPGPVNVVDGAAVPVDPVQVVEPVIIEPVIVGTPIIPAPAVVLPDILN